jgi:hypothetical protein
LFVQMLIHILFSGCRNSKQRKFTLKFLYPQLCYSLFAIHPLLFTICYSLFLNCAINTKTHIFDGKRDLSMKKKILSAFLTAAVLISTFSISTSPLFARESNEVSNLALILPDSDIILAIDMHKTLNVVGPSLLNQDEKKIENLRKLMKSLENVIGLNPYDVNQIVAGVKLPSTEEKDFFEKLDYTIILRTSRANDVLLDEWGKKIDAIEIFNREKEPSETYLDSFKTFRSYQLTTEETEKISKLNREFDEILKKSIEIGSLLGRAPAAVRANKLYKDSLKKNSAIIASIHAFRTVLKKDSDVKILRDASVKLQNRWYDVSLEDPKRGEKLAAILREAKEMYPSYKIKVENLAQIDALISLSNFEFYTQLAKHAFGLPQQIDFDFDKDPNQMMTEKLDETIKALHNFSKPAAQVKLVSINLQKLENAMNIRLKKLEEVEKFEEISQPETIPVKTPRSLAKSLKENARISEVNGKRLITIDYEKISFWNPAFNFEESEKTTEENGIKITADLPEVKTEVSEPKIASIKGVDPAAEKDDKKKEEKKKEHFAIGYLDERTMVFGFESGIRSILSRTDDYKNPKAAEMLNSFKNPLISFAMNSRIFQNFSKVIDPAGNKKGEKEKKQTPTDKFFNDINIFGSIEYDGDGAAGNDLIMSLGFTKNRVEEVFSVEADEAESSVFEWGDYQISKAIFYDLLNTLKGFKASISFKFEKKKTTALIESAPRIIQEVRATNRKSGSKSDKKPRIRIESFGEMEQLLSSPKFYAEFFQMLAERRKK